MLKVPMRMSIDEYLSFHLNGMSMRKVGLLYLAWHTAHEAHVGQTRRSGEQYLEHLMIVSRKCREYGLPMKYIVAAMLHDILEDCQANIVDLEKNFGKEISRIVLALTCPQGKKHKEYFRQIRKASRKRWGVIIVKMIDRIHNLETPFEKEEVEEINKLTETLDDFLPLCDSCRKYIPKKFRSSFGELQFNIFDRASRRQAELLGK